MKRVLEKNEHERDEGEWTVCAAKQEEVGEIEKKIKMQNRSICREEEIQDARKSEMRKSRSV